MDPGDESAAAHVLVVTDQAVASPALLDAIRGRAARSPARFRILVPNPAPAEWHPAHPERHDKVTEAKRELAEALPAFEKVAGHSVESHVSIRHDAMDAIEETLQGAAFDEIILTSLPHRISRWLHVDLPHRVAHLGLPVTTVTAERALSDDRP